MAVTGIAAELQAAIDAYLQAARPASMLVLHAGSSPITAPPDCTLRELAIGDCPAALAGAARVDLALLDLTRIIKVRAAPLLAEVRDLYAKQVLALVQWAGVAGDATWTVTEMAALGMQPTCHAGGVGLFQFDIATYKTTPDWLNPDNWANPERWNKDRW